MIPAMSASMGVVIRRVARGLLLLVALVAGGVAVAAEPVRIGILSFRPKVETLKQWQPLAVLLKQSIPGRDFRESLHK